MVLAVFPHPVAVCRLDPVHHPWSVLLPGLVLRAQLGRHHRRVDRGLIREFMVLLLMGPFLVVGECQDRGCPVFLLPAFPALAFPVLALVFAVLIVVRRLPPCWARRTRLSGHGGRPPRPISLPSPVPIFLAIPVPAS